MRSVITRTVPGTLHAVACHIIHLAVMAGVQPGLQAGLVARQVDVRDPHLGKAQLRAPGLDGTRKFVEVG
jgi:hypothetical protein